MNNLYPTDWTTYLQIALILLRALGLFMLVPGLSHPAIPRTFKVLFCMTLSFTLHPMLKAYLPEIHNNLGEMAALAIRETAIGFIMGYCAYVLAEGASLAAQFVGYQMGFGTAGLLEPQSQSSVSVVVHLKVWLILVLFFVTNMHHHVIQVFVNSYEITRPMSGSLSVSKGLLDVVLGVTGRMFILAVQLASPIMFLMLAANLAIAVLARMLPQMNILLFSFPVTILVGFAGLYIIAPDLLSVLENLLGEMGGVMVQAIKVM